MKQFLAVYIGSPESFEASGWNQLDAATRQQREQAGMKAWGDWMTQHQKSVVSMGGPLGKTKRVSRKGVADVRNQMAGFTIVQAESHEEAARLFENHPHFSLFPGEAVEIMECLPIPGQH